MRCLLVLSLAAAFAGCGGAEPSPGPSAGPPGETTAPQRPTSAAPKLDGSLADGPPPAWLETDTGSFWLGYSSYCWGTVCADFVAPSCDDREHTPKIELRRGATVLAHLGFDPTEVAVSSGLGESMKLATSRSPAWHVKEDGLLSLFARAAKGGDARYVACVTFE